TSDKTKIATVLRRHFSWSAEADPTPELPRLVRREVEALRAGRGARENFRFGAEHRYNVDSNSRVRTVKACADHHCSMCISFNGDYFRSAIADVQSTILLHEMLHNINDGSDFAQEDEVRYPGGGKQAWENPASFAGAIRDLGNATR